MYDAHDKHGIDSLNFLDSFKTDGGAGACRKMLSATSQTCDKDFCPDPEYCSNAGQCNAACNFCKPMLVTPLSQTPPCVSYPSSKGNSSENYLDAYAGKAACNAVLAGATLMQLGVASLHPPQENCFSLFCPTCPMAHRCDASCGYCRSN